MSKRPPSEAAVPPLDAGPFSRPLEVRSVPEDGLDLTIEAKPEERGAIAGETGLPGVGALAARFHVVPRAGGRLAVEGELEATVTQMCVVTLEPFDSIVTRAIDLTFAPQAPPVEVPSSGPRSRRREREAAAREVPSPRPVVVPGNDDQEDPPDPIVDGRIDLGAIALEFLTLSLDLYPRRPGVHFDDVSVGDKDDAQESPFAALQRFKDRS